MGDRKMYRGELFFLSNMYPRPISYNGLVFSSAENLYQWLKFQNHPEVQQQIIDALPKHAKVIAAQHKSLIDPKFDKEGAMYETLCAKFEDSEMKHKLVDTGDDELVEWNTWGDVYWGKNINTGKGMNKLGEMHMQLRNSIRMERAFFGV